MNEIRDISKYDKIIAIGDLHGSYDQLMYIVHRLGITDADGNWIISNVILIQIGDLIDRGPKSMQVS